ncbi:MAG: hypothetical protein JOZ57_12830 [Abitibacteriaceae bacterium]|nr:hypothetical protein [Abditibacteriaceae bacterium]
MLLLLLLLLPSFPAHAELPPDAYRHMQNAAPEFIYIQVLAVNTRNVPHGQNVDLKARVVVVKRTATRLRAGHIIHIDYFHRTTLLIGPGPVPLLETGKQYPAFLEKVNGQNIYRPVAGAFSFEVMS